MINKLNPDVASIVRESGLSLKAFWMHIVDGDDDFELSTLHGEKTYRFIKEESLDNIMQEELASDTYVLGCFSASTLSTATGLPIRVFNILQMHDAYDAIGEIILSLNKLEELQKLYVTCDGYGYHFAHYDHNEEELYIQDGLCYSMFRTN